MSSSTTGTFRFKILHKIALIGLLCIGGMFGLGGIGYLATHNIDKTAVQALERNDAIRQSLVSSYNSALASESQARELGNLNRRLIELLDLVISGPHRGVTEQQILDAAKQLARDAEIINSTPGAERLVEGTKNSIGQVTVNNFADVATLLEFELPDLYSLSDDRKAFKARQGDIALSMAKMYYFISRNLEELAGNSLKQVQTAKQELSESLRNADQEMTAIHTQLNTTSDQAGFRLIVVFVVTLILLGVIFALFTRSMTKPLVATVAMARSLRSGRVSARLQLGNRGDEFGSMARALNEFADELEHEVVDAMQKLAEGDFNIALQPIDDNDLVRTALLKTAKRLSETMEDILCASEQIANGSVQVADSAQQLSHGASSSAASLQEISASMNQMGSQIQMTANNAEQASNLAGDTKNAAETGSQKMRDMVKAMTEIRDAGQNIGKIIKVIDEIAFQTNLLALNAAVEAARAGHHGKGFAVVAEEVRNLASRSAKAARETTELIQSSVGKTELGVQVADDTAQALSNIVGGVTQVSDLVAEIAAAGKEQAAGIAQVNLGLTQIDQVVQANTASSEESAATSEELSAQAARLKELLSQFKIQQSATATSVIGTGQQSIGWTNL